MFFFFQAEDGIRDKLVTGVQTCALPIWNNLGTVGLAAGNGGWAVTITNNNLTTPLVTCAIFINTAALAPAVTEGAPPRPKTGDLSGSHPEAPSPRKG